MGHGSWTEAREAKVHFPMYTIDIYYNNRNICVQKYVITSTEVLVMDPIAVECTDYFKYWINSNWNQYLVVNQKPRLTRCIRPRIAPLNLGEAKVYGA